MKNMIKKVKKIAFHRNGISGASFHIVEFTGNTSDCRNKSMIAFVFEEKGHVAVFDFDLLKQGVYAFFENSWRGDNFEPELRKALEERR